MPAQEVLHRVDVIFHDMSQPLCYLQIMVELVDPDKGLYGKELAQFKAAVDEVTISFREVKSLVNQALED